MPDRPAVPFAPGDYAVPVIHLDNAARHPLPTPVVERLEEHVRFLGRHPEPQGLVAKQVAVRADFARLIGADPDEIALVPSTMFAENLLLNALDLPRRGAGIVTDDLHFAGSLALYRTLAAEGAPVTILPQDGGAIHLERLEAALKTGIIALVAISSVSHRNGFRHDLDAVCALAHAHGAMVYADAIQHAGALPLDVRDSGVDFVGCGTYKWLLGDMGLAFLYVRRARWPRLRRRLGGAAQQPAAAGTISDPSQHFHIGTLGATAVEAMSMTLPRVAAFVAGAARCWAPLTERIDARFADLGLSPLTPAGSHAPIRAFVGDAIRQSAIERLRFEGIRVGGGDGYLRLSPSVFTTLRDIDEAAVAIRDVLRR